MVNGQMFALTAIVYAPSCVCSKPLHFMSWHLNIYLLLAQVSGIIEGENIMVTNCGLKKVVIQFIQIGNNKEVMEFLRQLVLEIDIVMSSSLFMLITYYSVMTDTNECD